MTEQLGVIERRREFNNTVEQWAFATLCVMGGVPNREGDIPGSRSAFNKQFINNLKHHLSPNWGTHDKPTKEQLDAFIMQVVAVACDSYIKGDAPVSFIVLVMEMILALIERMGNELNDCKTTDNSWGEWGRGTMDMIRDKYASEPDQAIRDAIYIKMLRDMIIEFSSTAVGLIEEAIDGEETLPS